VAARSGRDHASARTELGGGCRRRRRPRRRGGGVIHRGTGVNGGRPGADERPEPVRGDVHRAIPSEETFVHGGAPGEGPATPQATPTKVGERRWGRRREGGERAMVPRERPRSYYGRPVVKPPVWTWEIPTYFFFGGMGGASSALALGAEIAGNRRLARRAWLLALGSISISPPLLISD